MVWGRKFGIGAVWWTRYLRIGVPQTDAATDEVVLRIDPESMTVTKTVLIHPSAPPAWIAGTRLFVSGFPLVGGSRGTTDPTLFAVDVG